MLIRFNHYTQKKNKTKKKHQHKINVLNQIINNVHYCIITGDYKRHCFSPKTINKYKFTNSSQTNLTNNTKVIMYKALEHIMPLSSFSRYLVPSIIVIHENCRCTFKTNCTDLVGNHTTII